MMNRGFRLDETIEVARPLHEAFAYLAAFNRIEEWDPAVARALKLTEGPTAVGSKFRVDMKAGFSLEYTVVVFEPERRLLMNVQASVFTAVEEILFVAAPGGTRVRYIATFTLGLRFALLAAAFPGLMDRTGKEAVAGLKVALADRQPAPLPSRRVALGDALLLPGLARFTRLGYAHARKHWGPLSAHLGGRHILVTGATSGLGLATARALAERGASLTLVARDADKGKRIASDITRATGNTDLHIEEADLSCIADVHRLADRLVARGRPLDVLVNNAGALFNAREVTTEGHEKSFALLLLGPYLLTERLHPLLKSAQGRVVNVLSGGMYTQRIAVDDLENARAPYSGEVAYARAKRGLMMMTTEWAERWRGDGIVVNAMHPGWADTPGVQSSLPRFYRVVGGLLRTPEEGADTIVWLAAATEAAKVTGCFWLDRQQHPAHVLSRTHETELDKSVLVSSLSALARRGAS